MIIPSDHITIPHYQHTLFIYTIFDFILTWPRHTKFIVFIYSFLLICINFGTHFNNTPLTQWRNSALIIGGTTFRRGADNFGGIQATISHLSKFGWTIPPVPPPPPPEIAPILSLNKQLKSSKNRTRTLYLVSYTIEYWHSVSLTCYIIESSFISLVALRHNYEMIWLDLISCNKWVSSCADFIKSWLIMCHQVI